MRFSSLFAKAAPLVHREEPVAGVESTVHADVPHLPSSSRKSDGTDSVFELLGGPPDEVRWKAEEPGPNEADRLMGTLYAQYCQAINSPHALESGSGLGQWSACAPPSSNGCELRYAYDGEALPIGEIEAVAGRRAHGASGAGSISDVLGDINRLDEAFGPLTMEPDVSGATGAPQSPPEILRLFAPQEWPHEATLHRIALPAALAQREHHTLAIDSPLPILRTAADGTTQESE